MTRYFFHIARILAALILFQTLFFKFSAAPESVELFTQIGMEPSGRIGTGVVELFAVLFLVVPSTAWFGALLGMGLMLGAMYFHVTVLGINLLFWMAVVTFLSCAYVLWYKRKEVPFIA